MASKSEKVQRIEDAFRAFESLEASIVGTRIDNPKILAGKISAIGTALEAMHESGKGMDEASIFPVPRELLSMFDEDVSNPEMYRIRTYEEIESKAAELGTRIQYLQSIQDLVKESQKSASSTSK